MPGNIIEARVTVEKKTDMGVLELMKMNTVMTVMTLVMRMKIMVGDDRDDGDNGDSGDDDEDEGMMVAMKMKLRILSRP